MNAKERLHRLLHLAFLEIRIDAHEGGTKKPFHLADLFHNVPLQLQRVSNGDGTYEQVLENLRARAAEKGCERWLEQAANDSPPAKAGVSG